LSGVVSLLPSATEIVFALGRGDQLVGRSHECDHPSQAARLPVCTRASFADGSAGEIDARVRDRVRRGLSLYDVDFERLERLAPELVLTQDQCRVCAVHRSDLEAGLAELTGSPVAVLSLAPALLGDVWRDIVRVGDALGAGDDARALARRLADRVSEIGERVGPARQSAPRPTVLCLEWTDPPMAAGNWVPELVRVAGGEPLLGRTGEHSPAVSWADVARADPDVLVVTACGFDLPRTRSELRSLVDDPRWTGLRAVREGGVFLADGNAYFNRPGPRLVESIEILAEILHPECCDFGHAGRGFARQ
jgi:iron complex transport system substrate-binding protein